MLLFAAVFSVAILLADPFGESPSTSGPATDQQPTEDAAEEKIYIPKDLDDCFAEFKRILSKDNIEAMQNKTEQDMIAYHFGRGRWMRNNWGLWRGSRLAKWFNDKGIFHPDDMSGIILDSFGRHLHSKPIQLEEQIRHYQEYWKKVKGKKAREAKPQPAKSSGGELRGGRYSDPFSP